LATPMLKGTVSRDFLPVLRSRVILCRYGSGKIFDAAPAVPAPAPTLLYSEAKCLNYRFHVILYDLLKILTEWVINSHILCHFSIPTYV
jgi:hypothetical protein